MQLELSRTAGYMWVWSRAGLKTGTLGIISIQTATKLKEAAEVVWEVQSAKVLALINTNTYLQVRQEKQEIWMEWPNI